MKTLLTLMLCVIPVLGFAQEKIVIEDFSSTVTNIVAQELGGIIDTEGCQVSETQGNYYCLKVMQLQFGSQIHVMRELNSLMSEYSDLILDAAWTQVPDIEDTIGSSYRIINVDEAGLEELQLTFFYNEVGDRLGILISPTP